MRSLFIPVVLTSALLASGVDAHDYKPRVSNCRPSLEAFIKHDAGGGTKILEDHGGIGAVQEYTMRWNSGTVERVTVAPAVGPDGALAICVVAAKFVRKDYLPASATR
jgi:hypothetical protein